MIRQHTSQPAFSGGEMSPLILGRHDTERFLLGGQRVENFIARHQGPLVRRRGTQWIRPGNCANGRLVNFERSCSDAEMLQIGCGNILVGAVEPADPPIPVTVLFEQFDVDGAPFGAHLFNVQNELGEELFYRSAYVSGSMVVKMSITPNNPALSVDCTINSDTLFAYVYGLCEFTFDGGYVMFNDDPTPRDPDTEEPIVGDGGLHVAQTLKGRVGAYSFHDGTTGDSVDIYADDWAGLMAGIALQGGVFCAMGPLSFFRDGQYVQQYYSEDTTGYFVGSDITTFQACSGYAVDYRYTLLTECEDLGLAVARTGSAARTQNLTDYNSGTRTFTGTKSRATFTVHPETGKTMMTSILTFTVTPEVGDPYTLIRVAEHDVTEPTTTVAVEYPWIPDAAITLTSWSFTHTMSVYDDFEDGTSGTELIAQDASPTWGYPGTFMCPAPNGGCFDDFEAGDDTETPLVSVTGGYGWNAAGFFISKDAENAYDDFESYTEGEITTSPDGGYGWASYGFLYAYNYLTAYDDFETGVEGTVVTVTGGSNWEDDGFFIS